MSDQQPRELLLERLKAIPRYRMMGRYGGEVRCEIIDTPGVGEWVRISDVLVVAEGRFESERRIKVSASRSQE